MEAFAKGFSRHSAGLEIYSNSQAAMRWLQYCVPRWILYVIGEDGELFESPDSPLLVLY
jgi:hypothetical protein